jgi:hypothetical protein
MAVMCCGTMPIIVAIAGAAITRLRAVIEL